MIDVKNPDGGMKVSSPLCDDRKEEREGTCTVFIGCQLLAVEEIQGSTVVVKPLCDIDGLGHDLLVRVE